MHLWAIIVIFLCCLSVEGSQYGLFESQTGDTFTYRLVDWINSDSSSLEFINSNNHTDVLQVPEESIFVVSPFNMTVTGSPQNYQVAVNISFNDRTIVSKDAAYGGGFFVPNDWTALSALYSSYEHNTTVGKGWTYTQQVLINTRHEFGYVNKIQTNDGNNTGFISYHEFHYDKTTGALNYQKTNYHDLTPEHDNVTQNSVFEQIDYHVQNSALKIPWNPFMVLLALFVISADHRRMRHALKM